MKKGSSHLCFQKLFHQYNLAGPLISFIFFCFFHPCIFRHVYQWHKKVKSTRKVANSIFETFNETFEEAGWEKGIRSYLTVRRDTKYNFRINILEISVKTPFRGSPSVWPMLSVISRVYAVLNLNRAQAPGLHCQNRIKQNVSYQNLPFPRPYTLPTCYLSHPTVRPWFFQTG